MHCGSTNIRTMTSVSLSINTRRRIVGKLNVTLFAVQWYFHKTGTMGTLASQAEIGVRV